MDVLEVALKRFTVEQFENLAFSGLLSEDDRVELLDGRIIQMNPIGDRHVGCVVTLTALFAPLIVRGEARVSVQNPVTLNANTQLYPDVAVIRRVPGIPSAQDVRLLVEVSDTTLGYDLGDKLPPYARAGVQETWIVNLGGGQLMVYRQPGPTGYTQTMVLSRGQQVAAVAFPDLMLDVSEILG